MYFTNNFIPTHNSSLVRALRLLIANGRGSSYVSRGLKTATVSVQSDGSVVTIERGEGHGMYRLALAGQPERTYTKLNGEVPEAITQFLRMSSSTGALNIAGQFDPPYLLADTGAAVARTLGELTHVTVLLEAARESNRRRLAAAGTLKVRQADLATLVAHAQRFAALREQAAAVTAVEARVAETSLLADRTARLRALISRTETAHAVASRAMPTAVPNLDKVEQTHRLWCRLSQLLCQVQRAVAASGEAQQQLVVHRHAEQVAHDALHELLVAAGQCPTCGRVLEAV
jgi:hypothetical protein